jgi:hypothetical protein
MLVYVETLPRAGAAKPGMAGSTASAPVHTKSCSSMKQCTARASASNLDRIIIPAPFTAAAMRAPEPLGCAGGTSEGVVGSAGSMQAGGELLTAATGAVESGIRKA